MLDRRQVLVSGAAGAVLSYAGRASSFAATSENWSQEPLREIGYENAHLAPDSVAARQLDHTLDVVFNLSNDSILYPFRRKSGLASPGEELGGWYACDGFAPGAQFGQWASAFAYAYARTGELKYRTKLTELIHGYAATLHGPKSFYEHNRFPAYDYDKVVFMLVNARQQAGVRDAKDILSAATKAALPYLPARVQPHGENDPPGADFSAHVWDESYTLAENQLLAWRMTGSPLHRELADRFYYTDFYSALARGENALPGKHAYSHANSISSAAAYAEHVRKPEAFLAARNGFDFILAQSYATGGWGPAEAFVDAKPGMLAASLDRDGDSFETPCGSYAHFKLTRRLLRMTRDPRYGDSMERVYYNTILGALPLQSDGRSFYYSDYRAGTHKGYHKDAWPCCSGSISLITADYGISAVLAGDREAYVNLYLPGRYILSSAGVAGALRIETDYPYSGEITLVYEGKKAEAFDVYLRIPSFASRAEIRVNGRNSQEAAAGTFARVHGDFSNGDRIELSLDWSIEKIPLEASRPDIIALRHGPLILMPINYSYGPEMKARPGISNAEISRLQRNDKHTWLLKKESPGKGYLDQDQLFRAFPDFDTHSYSVYMDLVDS